MNYENPKIPEGINVSKEHPLKEFGYLFTGAILIVVVLVTGLSLSAKYLVSYVPFETESALSGYVQDELENMQSLDADQLKIQAYLQDLADQLAVSQNLPEDFKITVHYVDDDLVNAFATLGGHVLIFRGLLQKMPHENALSMVMAHEIAHVKHRDPLVSLGRGVTMMLLLSTVTGFSDSGFVADMLGQAGMVTSLSFGRDQETDADSEAMHTLQRHYHHLDGAAALFELLIKQEHGYSPPAFMRTHPLTQDRINRIHQKADTLRPTAPLEMVALPPLIRQLQHQN